MRNISALLAGSAAVILVTGLAYVAAVASGDGTKGGAHAQTPTKLSLENGVSISEQCDGSDSEAEHITFSSRSSHTFLGYGVNVETQRASSNISQTVDDMRKLGFVWARMVLSGHKSDQAGPSDEDADEASQEPDTGADSANIPEAHKHLIAALQAAGIKVVNWLGRAPASFYSTNERRAQNGKPGRRVRDDEIPALAQYYANYLRSLEAMGVHPDLVELINEPNLRQNGKYRPEVFAALVRTLETDLSAAGLHVNIAAPGTSARMDSSANFLEALQQQGAIPGLKAISIHTYYRRDDPNHPPLPPADDPSFQTMVSIARNSRLPMMSTEFGGTDIRTKQADPSLESVDTAEEFKAALDLIRSGESAALVWNLYPNHNFGQLLYTWALIDPNGPTKAYWPFYILSRKVPVGSDVLAVEHSDVSPSFAALGFAAFRSGPHVYVGLANPAPSQPSKVDVDLSALGKVALVHAAGFLPTHAVEENANFRASTCPSSVTIPSGTGTMLEFDTAR